MKKLLALASVAAVLTSGSAFAKTEGNYLGINLLNTSVDHKALKDSDGDGFNKKNDNFSFGVNYKYAFNFDNGIFVAPEVFVDKNDVRGNNEGVPGESRLKYTYGAKVNLGYDVTDDIAVFVNAGHSESKQADAVERSNKREAFSVGGGVKYALLNNFDVSLSYETYQFGYSTKPFDLKNFNPDFRVIKVGFAHKF